MAGSPQIPLGSAKWLTIVAPDEQDGTELLLEPDSHPAVGPFKSALVQDGIPFTSFAVDDVYAEYERLRTDGVVFTQPPVAMGSVTTAVLDDTCGNLIQLAQKGEGDAHAADSTCSAQTATGRSTVAQPRSPKSGISRAAPSQRQPCGLGV